MSPLPEGAGEKSFFDNGQQKMHNAQGYNNFSDPNSR